jgi:hypothetical protein
MTFEELCNKIIADHELIQVPGPRTAVKLARALQIKTELLEIWDRLGSPVFSLEAPPVPVRELFRREKQLRAEFKTLEESLE